MTKIDKCYIEYYTAIIQDFVCDMKLLPHPDIKEKMPQPFLPMYGKNYETSALKLIIVGQDTNWWGDLREFIAAEKANPGSTLLEGLTTFRSHKFTSWGGPRQSFWGFAMMFLAALHGQDNWGAMKQGKMTEILDSFAWGNSNAVEIYSKRQAGIKVPRPYWESIRKAGERFNRFRHIQKTLRPNVVLLMNNKIDSPAYFEGYSLDLVSKIGRLAHYQIRDMGVDVFLVPHPRSMNFKEGTSYFRDELKKLFVHHGFTTVFNKFLSGQEEGKKAMDYLYTKAPAINPDFNKYQFVAWVADELKKHDAFMSVPTLMDLVNAKGGKTNYGTSFTGGRGSYRLVSSTYHELESAGQLDRAHNVAVAFRRPNFEYAYNTD